MKYKTIIIGAGPAGLMAAIQSKGKTIIFEKNSSPGKKLLITGKGRCNITNSEKDTREFIKAFGKNGRFLISSMERFGVSETIGFFESRGLKIKEERGRRIFPVSDSAEDVLTLFLDELKSRNIEIQTGSPLKKINVTNQRIENIVVNGSEYSAEKYIIATGGLSYPSTGSTGEAFKMIKSLGHKIVPLKPALTPIITEESYIKELQGLSLKNCKLYLYSNNKKIDEGFGEALFTHEGMSGPVILDLSKSAGEAIERSEEVQIKIDFKPALDFQELDRRIQRDLLENRNRIFRNSLDRLMPKKLIPVIIKLSEIDPEKKCSNISKSERKKITNLLKDFSLSVKKLSGFNKAIVTSGGINLKEIDPNTMRSKIIENLYFAGEIIDIDGPTGGYNLQVCWSTGFSAGTAPIFPNC